MSTYSVALVGVSACPSWSRTMKQASCSSTDQGGGKRQGSHIGFQPFPTGIAPLDNILQSP
jgi:hypothetical protein